MKMTNWFNKAAAVSAIADAYYEDVDDIASVVVFNTDNPSGGRAATNGKMATTDDRIICASISFSEGSNSEGGQITIDFSDNDAGYCVARGNRREGKIILTYSGGPRTDVGFKVVLTFEDYMINGIALAGTRTIERVAAAEGSIKHHITLEDGQAVWPDNKSLRREADFTREWILDSEDERVVLDGEASGITRRGREYSLVTTAPLVYRRACILSDGIYMAVEGTKAFTTESKQIIIDYGDGACDRSVNITVNGTTHNVSVDN
ncbi:MAG TPA: hypothetical protein VD816_03555 [Ohtaekwangia sp.]|nr:hypothetical protein [Ohtaekwangia sp.]